MMVAIMKYENGLRFTQVVCEDEETAKKWLKENHWVNPYSYEIVPITFIAKENYNNN